MQNIIVDTRLSTAIEGQNRTIQALALNASDLACDLDDKLRGYTALATLLDGFGESKLGNLATSDQAQLLHQINANTRALSEELQELIEQVRAAAVAQGHLLEGINVVAEAKAKLKAESTEAVPAT